MIKPVDWFIQADLGLDFIIAGSTTRALKLKAANSQAPWNNFNLGLHVGDEATNVKANRQLLVDTLSLPSEPFWLEQVHGTEIVKASNSHANTVIADASYTDHSQQVLAIMTADCLPIILASENADWLAVVHCGWRSLAAGILLRSLKTTQTKPAKIRAWLGPAIGANAFEVGDDVRAAFINQQTNNYLPLMVQTSLERCFITTASGKYLADLATLATLQLQALGLTWIKGGNFCTYTDQRQFFSYRRDGKTGRMATLAWIQ